MVESRTVSPRSEPLEPNPKNAEVQQKYTSTAKDSHKILDYSRAVCDCSVRSCLGPSWGPGGIGRGYALPAPPAPRLPPESPRAQRDNPLKLVTLYMVGGWMGGFGRYNGP